MKDDKFDTCGCCEGEERLTPVGIYNRPGLDALAYRVGTHAAFFETMIADLARQEIAVKAVDGSGQAAENRFRPLRDLKTRRRDDLAIALLDAWATIADVLTFYQERIANEGYLQTATERRSILELARLVGYELTPGVAASTFLTFIVDEMAGAALIPKGTRAQSIPKPGQTMQSFETIRDLEARFEYNEIKLRTAQPQFVTLDDLPPALYLSGQRADLRPPDRILLAFDDGNQQGEFVFDQKGQYRLARVRGADLPTDPARTRVEVEWEPWMFNRPRRSMAVKDQFDMAGVQAKAYLEQPWNQVVTAIKKMGAVVTPPPESVEPQAGNKDVGLQGLAALSSQFAGNIYAVLGQEVSPSAADKAVRAVVLLRLQAHLHGHNAPWEGISQETGTGTREFKTRLSEWPQPRLNSGYHDEWKRLFENGGNAATITLDGVYEQIGVDSLVVLAWREVNNEGWVPRHALFKVTGTGQVSTALFNVPATATRLELTKIGGDDWKPDTMAIIRSTTVYAASEFVRNPVPGRILDLAPIPDTYTVTHEDQEKADAKKCTVWQLIAGRYVLSPELLAEANNLTVGDTLTADQRLVIPAGKTLELDGIYQDLKPGRWIALSGMRADIPVIGQEVALIKEVEHRFGKVNIRMNNADLEIDLPSDVRHTFLTLTEKPSLPYRRSTLRLSANVVPATHGETARGIPPRDQDVILGSGNGAEAHQRFALKLQAGKQLTYLSAATALGIESTLQVYVGDVLWQPRKTLLGAGPTEHVYTVATDDDGQTTVIFGDGNEGARPPTGRENVWARYRIGIGQEGNVKARQISLLATRPPGVKEVKNWVPATGGADPEGRDQARQNVTFAARTLDRLVGLQDYQDFARTFAGVGKALASDQNGKVTVCVAGQGNAPLEGSTVIGNLEKALDDHDGSNVEIKVVPFTPRLISLDATVWIAADRLWEKVQPAVRAALEARFAFDRRELGQGVALSEIVRTIQEVAGVTHVQVTGWAALTEEALVARAAPQQAPAQGLRTSRNDTLPEILQVDLGQLAFIDPAVPSLIALKQAGAAEGGS